MPNIAQTQILSAIASLVDIVDDTGLILTRERFIDLSDNSEEAFIKLFTNLNNKIPKGWLVSYSGFEQRRGDRQCEVVCTFKYALECVYPYQDKVDASNDSHKKFRLMVEAVRQKFNEAANWNLGLDTRVEHQLLQATEDFVVRRWGKTAGAFITHYAPFELAVEVSESY